MPSRTRTVVAVLGMLALTLVSCADKKQPATTTQSPSPAADSTPEVPMTATPVIAQVVSPPVPAPATDGKTHLAYELQLTNVLTQDVTITSVDVMAGDQKLLTLTGDQVADWLRVIGTQTPTTTLAPAQLGILWLDVAVDDAAAVPSDLVHTIGVSVPKPIPPLMPATMTEKVAPVTVQTRKPVVIAPPLRGPNWLDADSCCGLDAHRGALNALGGSLWAAQRYAIDYVQLQSDGTIANGDVTDVDSYPYFGADVHAVADGPVVGMLDGLPEQIPTKRPTGLRLEEYGGNHIVQDIGDGNYAFYAHLKTGSPKVKVGDTLTTGQVIGSVGNTGNSDAPHLHFHVMSTPDPLGSDGLPFLFESFRLDNRVASNEGVEALLQGKTAPMQAGFTARDESDVSPLSLDVMTYEAQ